MRKEYTTISNFKIVEAYDNEEQKHFFITDKNGERISQIDFKLASEAKDYCYQLIEINKLLKDF